MRCCSADFYVWIRGCCCTFELLKTGKGFSRWLWLTATGVVYVMACVPDSPCTPQATVHSQLHQHVFTPGSKCSTHEKYGGSFLTSITHKIETQGCPSSSAGCSTKGDHIYTDQPPHESHWQMKLLQMFLNIFWWCGRKHCKIWWFVSRIQSFLAQYCVGAKWSMFFISSLSGFNVVARLLAMTLSHK